ncbi:hypothetical protein HOL59_03305 [Candidatus Woesearchaeota archaeon]|nr:hypothetical protein [Candidatus Woesearchaeota archaeon]
MANGQKHIDWEKKGQKTNPNELSVPLVCGCWFSLTLRNKCICLPGHMGPKQKRKNKLKEKQKLDEIILDSFWPLLEILPKNSSPKLLQLLNYVVSHPPKKKYQDYFASINELANDLSDYERLKDDFAESVDWAYSIFSSWMDDVEDSKVNYDAVSLVKDIGSSLEGIKKAVTVQGNAEMVQSFLTEINGQLKHPIFPPQFSHLGEIATKTAYLYRSCVVEKGNQDTYQLWEQFRRKFVMGTYPEVVSALAKLPSYVPPPLTTFISDAIENIGDADHLTELMRTISEHYHLFNNKEINNFLEGINKQYPATAEMAVKQLNQRMQLRASEKELLAREIEETSEKIYLLELDDPEPYIRKKEHDVALSLGPEKAHEFKKNIRIFEDVGIGSLTTFMNLYCKFLEKKLSEEDERHFGSMLGSLSVYSKRKQENKTILDNILSKGPTKINSSLRKKLKTEYDAEITHVWDLRPLQANLYSTYHAFANYQEVVNRKFEDKKYTGFLDFLLEKDYLEEDILVVAGGCGLAKKESLLVKRLREKENRQAELLLIDRNEQVTNLALLHSIQEGLYDLSDLPPVLNIDLTKISPEHFKELRDLMDRQILLTMFGGTPFNQPNMWEMYARERDIFALRKYGPHYDQNIFTRTSAWIKSLIAEERWMIKVREHANKPDLLITEGDSRKDLSYYCQPSSIEFLNKGIANRYQIYPDDLLSKNPLITIDDSEQKMKSFYLVREDHHLNKNIHPNAQAILVIDSGTLDEDKFNSMMANIGWQNDFFYHENSIIAVSQVAKPVRPYLGLRHFVSDHDLISRT